VLGYALYCGAFAAAGSLVSRLEDAQTVAFPLMLPLLFGYIVSFSAVDGANTLVWILAFVPLTSVVAMPTLYALGEAPLWAVGLSMVITALGVVAMAAARIYERSVLQSRKLSWRQASRSRREIAEERAGSPDGRPEREILTASFHEEERVHG
jgi:ABC-2 type transport system permease protein